MGLPMLNYNPPGGRTSYYEPFVLSLIHWSLRTASDLPLYQSLLSRGLWPFWALLILSVR